MASTLFDLAARLSLDTKDYNSGMDSAESRGKSFASSLGSVMGTTAKVMTSAITAASGAVVALTKASLDGYANFEQLKGGVETLYKTSSSTVMEYANQAYKTAGMSANQYMETATGFAASLIQSLDGDTAKAAEYADRAIRDMSDNANKMGTDIGAIQTAYQGFAKQNYTMLDNLKLGYGGTQQEMARLISDASKMTDVQRELGITVDEGSMSFGNIVNAISVMQKHLEITGTTASEAGTTISGSIGMMKASWDNLLVGMADDTQEMDVLIDNFVESVITVIGNLVPRIQTILGGIGEFIVKMVDVLAEQIPSLLQTLLPPLLQAATTLVTSLASAIPELLQIILEQLPMIVEQVVQVIPMLTEALLNLLPTLLEVGIQVIATIIQGIGEALPELIPTAVEVFMTLVETLYSNIHLILEAGVKLLEGLIQGIINSIPKLVAALPKVITAMVNYLTQAIPQLVQAGVKLLTALIQNLPQIISTIVAALPQIITAIVGAILSMIPQIIQAGIQLLTALIQALPQIIQTICAALPQIIDAICSTLIDNLPAIIDAGVQLFTALIQNLPLIIETIISAVPQIISALVQSFGSFTSTIWDIGVNIVKGIWEGIKSATTWLLDLLKGWVHDALGWIADLLGIHSPSTVMRDRIGKMMGLGVAEGIEDSLSDVEKASDHLLGAIPDMDGRDFALNVRRNMSDSYSASIDSALLRIEEVMRRFEQTVVIELDDRELGRAVRGYA